jgi:hypothetical protein
MKTTNTYLYDSLAQYIMTGDEAMAKKFIIENFDNFPEEVKESAIMIFFEEGIDAEIMEEQAIYEFQKKALDALSELEKSKKLLMDKSKIEELRSKIHSMI